MVRRAEDADSVPRESCNYDEPLDDDRAYANPLSRNHL